MHTLNARAGAVADQLMAEADRLRVAVHTIGGARVVDCGLQARGGLTAGLLLARLTAGDLLDVSLSQHELGGPAVLVHTDDPVRACLAAQYAGWQVNTGGYFAMGSGPMRAALGREKLFETVLAPEPSQQVVGALETRKLPTVEVVQFLAEQLGIKPANLTLAVAPAASLAGGVQVVARSVETAMHKLHELGFDVRQVVSAFGSAPLPPVAENELGAVGRTNDAILYAGDVTLYVDAPDEEIATIGPRVPSSASPDHGTRFAELFSRYNGDFYKIDPLLFSPARVTLANQRTGRCQTFGSFLHDLVRDSFTKG